VTTNLAKAILLRLKQIPATGKGGKPSFAPEPNGAYAVQFNPTSMKISRTNNIDKGGATTNTQRRQTPSVQPATLTFDLEFDTAEGDASGKSVDVRDLTHVVRQFTEPTKEKPKDPPPAVRFLWGTFAFTGIVTQLTEDLDYFSPDGRALRAKVSVTITEQNPDWEAALVGGGAADAKTATAPGGGGGSGSSSGAGGASSPGGVGGTGPGARPAASPVSTAAAKGGESIQQLLARMNADPATWRAAMAGLSSPLSLSAGAQVQLGARVSASAGLGAGGGFAAGAGIGATASVGAALGISAGASAGFSAGASAGFSAGASAGFSGGASAGFSAGASAGFATGASSGLASMATAGFSAGASAETSAGFVLAATGGVAASVSVVASAQAAAATAQARASFSVPAVAATASASASTATTTSVSASVSAVRAVDPRSQGYGRGIPLRARVVLP
jgi:hypothetical protein